MTASALRWLLNIAFAVALLAAAAVAVAGLAGQLHASHWSVVTDRPVTRGLVASASGADAGALYMSHGTMIVRTSGALQVLGIAHIAVMLAGVMGGLWLLRRLVGSIADGAPFDPRNARRLRRLAWLFVGLFLWTAAEAALAQALLLDRVVLADGARLLTSLSASVSGVENLRIDFNLEFGWLVAGLFAFVLAEAFRAGTLYREDSEAVV